MTITNAEIVGRLKLLADEHSKADSGSTTTAVSASLANESDYTNQFICFVNGDNANTDRIITDFDTATGTFTFSDLDNAVTNTDEFCVVSKGFQSDVLSATSIVANDMRNRGHDIDLFLNYATQLKEMYIYKTIELICASLMNDGQDHDAYYTHMINYKDLYISGIDTLIADYDEDEDGTISENEELMRTNCAVIER